MNLRDLKYLVAVATHRHFGKAAEASLVSQPALSMQLKKLEDELDVQLVERTNKQVMITPIGEAIVEKAKEILRLETEIKNIAATNQDPLAGSVTMGAFPTIAPYLFPHMMPQMSEYFPYLKLFLREEKTSLLIERLQQGTIDAAILAIPLPIEENLFDYDILFDEPFYLATSTKHPLANRKTINPQDINNQSLLLLEEGHCLRDQALDICTLIGNSEQDFRATSLETLRQMVASNLGITLIPKLAIQDNNSHIAYIPFEQANYNRSIALVWRKTSYRKALCQRIIKTINWPL